METNMTSVNRRRRGSKNVGKSEAGQALVELALTMPMLVVILFGAVELASVTYEAIELSNFTTSVSSSCACSDGTSAASCTLASCPTSQLEQILTVQTSATFTPLIRIPSLPT